MVRKDAIFLGVGATIAVGSVGYIAYQLRKYNPTSVPAGHISNIAVIDTASQPVTRNEQAVAIADSGPTDKLAVVLNGNASLLDEQDRGLVAQLLDLDQGHLFEGWPEPGTADEDKRRLLEQLRLLDASYHGGIAAYVSNARKLLQESKDGVYPFEGYVPSVPSGATLDYASPEFLELEVEGLREAGRAAFVLVAGGLGERLGYSGIKLGLPCECATRTSFLELYISAILAIQARAPPGTRLPLAIMTSDDTHSRTLDLLNRNNYFGMERDQITLLKQEKVACLIDSAAHLALQPGDPYAVQTKPHGHGDVHMLLAQSGLAASWLQAGLKWVCFFQDTNALVFRALLAALGVSFRHDFDMNSLAVPRKAREAIGAITRLTRPDGSQPLTINVEYNQLDPLLKSTISKEGDVNDETGYSAFPGNINQLILKLSSYVPQLAATGGVISEFVNPKYQDARKTAFKSSTRLECMMQDYPKALPSTAKVGFTTIKQVWATYSPVKNSPAEAAAKFKEGNPTHSATSGELDIYKANCMSLAAVADIPLPVPLPSSTFNGMTMDLYPRVVLSPSFAPLLAELKSKVAPGSITLSPGSVLVLDGPDISVQGPLVVRGALVVRAVPGAQVTLGGLTVENQGWSWDALVEDEAASEEERIRGFKVVRHQSMELVYNQPGNYSVPSSEQPQQGSDVLAEAAAEAAPAVCSVAESAASEPAPEAEVLPPPPSAAVLAPDEVTDEVPAASEVVAAAAVEALAAAKSAPVVWADDEPDDEPEPEKPKADASYPVHAPSSIATWASSSGLSAAAKPFIPGSLLVSAGSNAVVTSIPLGSAAVTLTEHSGSRSSKKKLKSKPTKAGATTTA